MKIRTRDMTLIALFTVLTIIGGKITVPILMIPYTLQLAICLLSGLLIGARRAMLAQGLYLLAGLLGLPVFASGGGLAYVLQPSFGYLPGMLLAAGLVGWLADLAEIRWRPLKFWHLLPINLAGVGIVYVIGVSYLYLIKNVYAGQSITLFKALQAGMIPFLPADCLKAVLAALIAPRLRRIIRPSQPTDHSMNQPPNPDHLAG
jgi:biotin transport system substrate-specific component